MKLEWMGKYRDFVAAIFRSGNAYSQIVKQQTSGYESSFGPYEVQIMEHIIEYGEQNPNMAWYAKQLGMVPSTFSKYVKQLEGKGLVEKYKTEGNKKNIILRLSSLGQKEYDEYSKMAYDLWFSNMFKLLDKMSDKQIKQMKEVIELWGSWCTDLADNPEEKATEKLIKITQS